MFDGTHDRVSSNPSTRSLMAPSELSPPLLIRIRRPISGSPQRYTLCLRTRLRSLWQDSVSVLRIFTFVSRMSIIAAIACLDLDRILVKGIRASGGNRHFYSLYPPRNATGPAVSKLMELGANIIGTTKTVQFANGDRATAVSKYPAVHPLSTDEQGAQDWVDYHAPFVVRSDGNAEPSGSSTGAGSGLSAHEFLDAAIGSGICFHAIFDQDSATDLHVYRYRRKHSSSLGCERYIWYTS